MKEEMKTITLRIPMDMYNDITKNGEEMFNPSFVALVEKKKREDKLAELDIKGIFTENEWKALASSLNGSLIDDAFRYEPQCLVGHNEDAEKYESSFSQFSVDVEEINKKIASLTRLQTSAIYSRIEDFWNNQNGTGYDFDKWAQF